LEKQELFNYILSAAASNRLSHSYLIESNDTSGALEAAKLMAMCFECVGQQVPCKKCKDCLKIQKDIHPDVITVSVQKDRATIGVEASRQIFADVFVIPNESKKKIYIIPQANLLTVAAQNALLKTLEESPEYAVFILITPEGEAMLETINSRCIRLLLSSEDEASKKKELQTASDFLKALYGTNEFAFLKFSDSLSKKRESLLKQISLLKNVFRDIIISKSVKGADLYIPDFSKDYALAASKTTIKQLLNVVNILEDAYTQIESNSNINLSVTVLFIKIWEEVH